MFAIAPLLFLTAPLLGKTAAVASPALPEPQVGLQIAVGAKGQPWKLIVKNQGGDPLRLIADGRLLTLEVKPPASADSENKKGQRGRPKGPVAIHCSLPDDMRPSSDDGRSLVLESGARYEEDFDPFAYCFGTAKGSSLVDGAEVTAKLGYTSRQTARKGAQPSEPFIVEPTAALPRVGALKEIVSVPFTLSQTPISSLLSVGAADQTNGSNDPDDDDDDDDTTGDTMRTDMPSSALQVGSSAYIEGASGRDLTMLVILKNVGKKPAEMHVRRDDFLFEVSGDGTAVRCGRIMPRRARVADLATRLGAGQSQTLDFWLGEVCPEGAFARPGLYAVTPLLVLEDPSVKEKGKPPTVTEIGARSSLVRVHSGPKSFYKAGPAVTRAP